MSPVPIKASVGTECSVCLRSSFGDLLLENLPELTEITVRKLEYLCDFFYGNAVLLCEILKAFFIHKITVVTFELFEQYYCLYY